MSASKNFDNFVQRQQLQVADAKYFDYEKEKNDWLKYLEELYVKVRTYLDEYVNRGSVILETSTVTLNEEGIGSYSAPVTIISVGDRKVVLTPIGTLLIGSKGRVDAVGSAGTARLTLVGKHVSDLRNLLKVTVNVVRNGHKIADAPLTDTVPEKIDWTWKIVSAPPATTFIELNQQSFLDMLVEVSGG